MHILQYETDINWNGIEWLKKDEEEEVELTLLQIQRRLDSCPPDIMGSKICYFEVYKVKMGKLVRSGGYSQEDVKYDPLMQYVRDEGLV